MNEVSKAKILNEESTIWTQIAKHFKDYSNKLIFETINKEIYERNN